MNSDLDVAAAIVVGRQEAVGVVGRGQQSGGRRERRAEEPSVGGQRREGAGHRLASYEGV